MEAELNGAAFAGRMAGFIDLENLLFPYREAGLLEQGLRELGSFFRSLRSGRTIVGLTAVANPGLCREVIRWLSEEGIRSHLHGGGPDAADLELCRRIEREIPSSCDSILIASGDHSFTESAVLLRQKGLHVEVVAHRTGLAAQLRLVADSVHFLPTPRVAA